MTFTPQDWKKLRNPILGLGFMLVVIGLLAYYADEHHQQQTQALQTQKNALNQARQKYLTSGHEKETIIKYLPLYQQLIDQGFIGEEQRIEWIETLRKTHQNNKLFGITYDVTEQKRVSPNYLVKPETLILQRSTMKIAMGLLHEGDLLTLLNALQLEFNDFIVKSCEIKKRVAGNLNVQNINENMTATCEIDWFSLKDPRLKVAS